MPLDAASEFLQKADEDLYLVDLVIDDEKVAPWIVGFHCQQAAEKGLKAVLVQSGIHFPKIHDLYRLVQLLQQTGIDLPDWADEVDALNPLAAEARYSTLLPEDFDSRRARRLACLVRDWAHELVAGDST